MDDTSSVNNIWSLLSLIVTTIGLPTIAYLSKRWDSKDKEAINAERKKTGEKRDNDYALVVQRLEQREKLETRIFQLLDENKKILDLEIRRNDAQDIRLGQHEKTLEHFTLAINEVKKDTSEIKTEIREVATVMVFIKENLRISSNQRAN